MSNDKKNRSNSHDRVERAVVLGGNGFLGRAVVCELLRSNYQVVAVTRSGLAWAPTDAEIDMKQLLHVQGDISERQVLETAMNDAQIVFHCASSTYPQLYLHCSSAEMLHSVAPVNAIMDAMQVTGVRKIVFPSSGGTVYADSPIARTEEAIVAPQTPYAIFKVAVEQLLFATAVRTKSFTVDVMRIGNLYGYGQPVRPGHGVLPHWFHAILNGQPIHVFGDGTAERDYVDVRDAAFCLVSACQRMDTSDIYNIGTGVATSLNELVSLLRSICDRQIEVLYGVQRECDVASVSLDSKKLLGLTHEFQFCPLREGISQYWKAILSNDH